METIRCYEATRIDFLMLQSRQEYLMEKKKLIHDKYCGVHSPSINSESKTTTSNESKVIKYIYEVEERKQANGMTIQEEIDITSKMIFQAKATMSRMENHMVAATSIEEKLYYLVIIKGDKMHRAVRKIARDEHMSESNIYHQYVPKVKEEIKKIKNCSV